jgi:hypothetical protein
MLALEEFFLRVFLCEAPTFTWVTPSKVGAIVVKLAGNGSCLL